MGMNRFRQSRVGLSWAGPTRAFEIREETRMKRSNEDLAARSGNGVRKVAGSEAVGYPRRGS